MHIRSVLALGAAMLCGVPAVAQSSFWNWESPHVHPIDLTPDGTTVLAVNTADNRLEVYAVDGATLVRAGAVPVGLDPVTVRARTNDEAWVVNHVSDSISVVDLGTLSVTATITTGDLPDGLGDEPGDVVFAAGKAFVTLSQLNQVKVYDPGDLSAPLAIIDIAGEDPRALATDGTRVYAAVFESGNLTTILPRTVVSTPSNPYPGDANPPPNDGLGFTPPLNLSSGSPPEVSLIVKRDAFGDWRDDNTGVWSGSVTWGLHDHDVAVIDASSHGVSYVTGLMNLNMHLSVRPGGDLYVVGTDATNEMRFEPNLNGRFVRVLGARIAAGGSSASAITDLNPHLDYTTSTVDQSLRDQSLADPRGIAWNAAGDVGYVTGMGSDNLIAVDASLNRLGRVDVGRGPTGVAVNDAGGVVYVLNKFDGTIAVVDAAAASVLDTVAFHDPTPAAIRDGRPHLYDAHATSGLGISSCGACHIDGRMDQIAWDLGDPSANPTPLDDALCNFGIPPLNQLCADEFHPMKGPMTTQTLVGIIGTEPLHWRGDRDVLADFNGAFESLLGDDEQLTPAEMTQFESFVGSLTTMPNPFRNIDDTLRSSLTIAAAPPRVGNPLIGESLYMTAQLDGVDCVTCHALPAGTAPFINNAAALAETQDIKIPQLRNMHEKTGFEGGNFSNNRGFGFTHDGSVPTLFDFLQFPGFSFPGGATGDQQRIDVEAFMFSFATDTHAGVGVQATVGGTGPDQASLRDTLVTVADAGGIELVAKGLIGGEARGYHYVGGGVLQSDRASEAVTIVQLDAEAGPAAAITWTLVPDGSGERIGVDRDEDGFLDRDELDACANPADGGSTPGDGFDPECCAAICGGDPLCCDVLWDQACADLEGLFCAETCPGDTDGDGVVDVNDLNHVILDWGTDGSGNGGDVTGSTPGSPPDGLVDVNDLNAVIVGWGMCL